MELRAEILLRAETQPDFVQAIDIVRPETRRMGAEVDVGRRPVGADDFERKGMARFRRPLPRESDTAARVPLRPYALRRL